MGAGVGRWTARTRAERKTAVCVPVALVGWLEPVDMDTQAAPGPGPWLWLWV